jgi:hypothetical protein
MDQEDRTESLQIAEGYIASAVDLLCRALGHERGEEVAGNLIQDYFERRRHVADHHPRLDLRRGPDQLPA